MKDRTLNAARHALHAVALATLALSAGQVAALGLGRMVVQSAIGEALRAESDVNSMTPEEAATLRLRVAPVEVYRAAGVEYNPVMAQTQVSLQRRADGRPYLRLTSDRAVQEPFVDVILELNWSNGRLMREYTLLFDPPTQRNQAAAPAPAAAPIISAAPAAPAPIPVPAPPPAAPAATPTPPAPAPAAARAPERVATKPAPAASPAAAAQAAPVPSEYRVRAGDSLSRIAQRQARRGVSLEQMLVALQRANPDAFVEGNMNRLRAGTVLNVPAGETAGQIPQNQAREVIRAHSADFQAYRQRLAGGVATAKVDDRPRQAKGQVAAKVDDRKPAPSASADKLTLAQGAARSASSVESKISRDSAKKDETNRLAELSRNVEELKKIQAASGAAPVVAAAPAVKASAAPAAAPVTPPAAAPAVPAAPAVAVPMPAPPPVVVAAASVAQPKPVPAATPASAPARPAPAVAKASAPAVPPPVPAVDEPGLLDSPWVLPAAGVLAALLAAFGAYRLRGRLRKAGGETSFLESRLQPDSFFGASGGQRIDTRDVATATSAANSPSSMSYSLSQLDAIGDVDPVAEADVYLAYGRDLQAEEILKEAMRTTPDRMAVRTKLLEVYAKRRDTKGFELLATQLYSLTSGRGEDWDKAQELGRQIDPDNPLYEPGGQPAAMNGQAEPPPEPLGASTMPQSVMPGPAEHEVAAVPQQAGPLGGLDLDLDLDLTPQRGASRSQAFAPADVTQAFNTRAELNNTDALEIDLGAMGGAAAADQAGAIDFDLGSISLDLDAPESVSPPISRFDSRLPELPDVPSQLPSEDGDPLLRKLELAEEFRQIGDMEGARDLLEEVASRGEGGVQARARAMLESLG